MIWYFIGLSIFCTLAWIITNAIRNAHHCSCNQSECGGGCEPMGD